MDAAGNAYVTGLTESGNFPTTANALQHTIGGGGADAFVTKLDPTGSALVYSTYLGGSGGDGGSGIAVDAAGNAYVTGDTTSTNFPITANALQHTIGGGVVGDAFVTKLDPTGSALVYSTYLGGNGDDVGGGIAVDAAGNAYVTGTTDSTNFPTTANALQSTFGGGGVDAFVTKLDPTGSTLVYSTYLGGSGDDVGGGIAVDAAGNAYVTGSTQSTNFPTTANALQPTFGGGQDAFVAKLDPTGSALVYSTYLGGSSLDEGLGIAVDAAGNAYVTGGTFSTNFPTTANALQPTSGGGEDVFVAKLDPTGSALVCSTYLGGSNSEAGAGIAVDAAGSAYVTGSTRSTDFPTTANALQSTFSFSDAFVAKVTFDNTLDVLLAGTGTGAVTSDPTGISCPGTCSATYLSGTTVTLTAKPGTSGSGSVFIGWSGDCTGTGTCTVSMSQARNVTATFDQRIYQFTGFFQPVDNLPTVNTVKAGSAIPVKFSLNGNQGLGILAPGFPSSVTIPCNSTAPADAIEQTVTAGSSSLTYDPTTDQYIYTWKTDKAWAGTCRQLVVKLTDGTEHRANFGFTK